MSINGCVHAVNRWEHQLKNHVTGDAHRKAVYSSLMAQRGHGKQTNIFLAFSKKTSFVPDPPSMPSPYGPTVHQYVRPVPGPPVRRPAYQPPVTSTTRVDAIHLSGALPSPSAETVIASPLPTTMPVPPALLGGVNLTSDCGGVHWAGKLPMYSNYPFALHDVDRYKSFALHG